MKLLARIFALFLIMPVVELALLVQVDKLIGFWPTVGIILFTGLLGGYLAKREGLAVWNRFNQKMAEAAIPGKEILDGVIILVAGALLITPGVVTDVFGFLGLLPPTRALIRKMVQKRIDRAMQRGAITMVGFDGWTEPPSYYETPPAGGDGWKGTGEDLPRHTDQ